MTTVSEERLLELACMTVLIKPSESAKASISLDELAWFLAHAPGGSQALAEAKARMPDPISVAELRASGEPITEPEPS